MKSGITLTTFPTNTGPVVFRDGNVASNIRTIKELGYTGLDLFIDAKTDVEIDELHKLFNQNNLEIAMYIAIFLSEQGVQLSSRDKDEYKRHLVAYKAQIDKAGRLGALTVPVGYLRGAREVDDPLEAYYERLAESLRVLTEYSRQYGIKVCLEAINRYEINSLNNIPECLAFMQDYQLDELYLLLDSFHMNIEDASIEGSIRQAGKKIGHFHAPDSNRYAAGAGHLDFPSMIGALVEVDYRGYLSLEAFPEPDPLTCARQHIQSMQRLLPTLTQSSGITR